jgi:hypothetical protein
MKDYNLTLTVDKPNISLVAEIKTKGHSREDAELQALLIIEEQIVKEFDYSWIDQPTEPSRELCLKAETEHFRKLFADANVRQ